MLNFEKVKEAYQKLKRMLYYERLDLINRNNLVEFESSLGNDLGQIEDELKKYLDWVKSYVLNNRIPTEVSREIRKISLSIYPKKIELKNDSFDPNFITDEIEDENFQLTKENVFVNMPISLQVLGILWLTEIGYRLDDQMGEYVYGNRLIKEGIDDDGSKFKGRLFKQYHYQYSKWWKKGLAKAKSILRDDEQDVVLINFDIKTFYHSICLRRSDLRRAIDFENISPENQFLHKVLEKVLEKYRNLITELALKKNSEGFSLPIGYIPSNVLANWYLEDFDKTIFESLRPAYYGRYVDDLFVVFQSGIPKSKSQRKKEQEEIENRVASALKIPRSQLKNLRISEAQYRFIKYLDKRLQFKRSNKTDDCAQERVLIDFIINDAKGLEVQSDKLFVYELSVGSPANLIENFIKDQRQKSSEFRFEAEESDQVPSDFGDILFEQSFENEDGTKAKIKRLSQDKFKLSVFLSRLLRRSSSSEEMDFSEQLGKLISFYKGANCIESWWVWEKVILLLIINKKPELFKNFIENCLKSINNLEQGGDLSSNHLEKCKNTLFKYLSICIKNGIAGDLKFASIRIANFLEKSGLSSSFQHVRANSFVRNEYASFPLIGLLKGAQDEEFTYFSYEKVLKQIERLDFEIGNVESEYPPIVVKYWQVALIQWLKTIYTLKLKTGSSINRTYLGDELLAHEVLEAAFEKYYAINYSGGDPIEFRRKHFFEWSKESVKEFTDGEIEPKKHGLRKIGFKINSEAQETSQFGLVNEYVDAENYKQSAKGTPKINGRRETALTILDEAQKKGCDLLIQPELAVPHYFVADYCQYSDRHEMGIVAGIEHFRVGNVIFNFILTVLPIKIDGIYRDSIPVLRLKNHYAHIEEVMVNGFQATVPKPKIYDYHLFQWRGLYFTNYYCYELADINHRSIFQGEIDVLIAPVWNPDTNYYNGIVETSAREIHCVFSQVNTANYGDTRWTVPKKTELKNPIVLKGGTTKEHSYILALAEISPKELREFQFLDYNLQKQKGSFKPTPPDFPKENVEIRLNGGTFYKNEKEWKR